MLGRVDDVEAVLEGLLVERGLREGFEPYDPPGPSLEGRADLRDLVTFTIDPETAEDFDDALSVRQEEDGIRAWVHIADVSHFVPAGRRSTAVPKGVRSRPTCPAGSRRCSRTSSPTTCAACARTSTA